jgi:cobalt-zinc-cadmium efflux system outer membrane protein
MLISAESRVRHLKRFHSLRWGATLSLGVLLCTPAFAQGGAAAPAAAAGPAAGQTSGQAQGQTAAQRYAAGASPAVDPRKPAPAKPGALTLQQVIDLAKAKNPTFLAADRNLAAVRAQEKQAAVHENPNLTIASQNVTEPGSENNPYFYSAQVSRLFERGEKRRWRIDAAKATTAQTSAQVQDTIRTTLLTLKTAFTNMLIAKQALELSTASLKDFRHEVEISNDRYQAGDLGKLDFERLDLQLGSFESDESNEIVNFHQASYQLQTLMGIDNPREDFDITGDVVPPIVAKTQADLIQSALAARPDYAAARLGVTAAEANVKLANANGTTDPTLEAEFDLTGPERSFGGSVQIPLRFFDKNQGNKETARFQVDATRFTEAAARNQVASDVAQAYVGYTQSKRLSDRYTEHYLDESTDVLSIAQFAFEHGGIALIDYLDALRDARTSTSNALSAYQQTWLAIHQLSAASATELIP